MNAVHNPDSRSENGMPIWCASDLREGKIIVKRKGDTLEGFICEVKMLWDTWYIGQFFVRLTSVEASDLLKELQAEYVEVKKYDLH